MYFKVLLNYILGYVTIEIEGYFTERFINICNNQKIFLWNMKRKCSTIVQINIGISDFKKIKRIAKKTKCRIKIQGKKEYHLYYINTKKEKYLHCFFY